MPTPRPGTLVTPPPMPAPTPAYPTPQPGSLAVAPATAPIEPKTPPPVAEEGLPPIIRTPLPAPVDATAIPTPPPASQHETTEELFSAERAAPAPAKPAVVRRRGQSGRMQLPAGEGPRPAPSAEPTVEPARAIDYVAPEGRSEAGSEPRPRPAWMQHAAIAAGVVVLIACIACAFLWRGASADADRLQRSLRDAQAKAEGLEKEVAGLQGRLNESEARSRDIEAKGKLLESERDRLAEEAKRLRDEIDQLKKQPAAAEAKPSAQPAAK
jgi:2-oxoglutarate dehydrogenase E2 component (dihydrolipoamide succinyltransferase)